MIKNHPSFLNSQEAILQLIHKLVDDLPELQNHVHTLNKDDVLFRQSDNLKDLYLLLDCKIELTRRLPDGSEISKMILKSGNFVGLIAFTTSEPTLTTATVLESGKALKMTPQEFGIYLNEHPQLRQPFQQLMFHNMVERYKVNVRLHTKTVQLKNRLYDEQKELKVAYEQLEESQQRLIHQEKMATLGELVAGFAHEVNNPASSLMRSAENLISLYSSFEKKDISYRLFKIGLQSTPVDSSVLRERMIKLSKEFPWIGERSMIRKIAQMPDEALEIIKQRNKSEPLDEIVSHFEAGKMIHNIQIASNRVANLVKSLRNYSRPDQLQEEYVDIRDGIKDTIQILGNRLKFLNLKLELNEIAKTCIRVSELNQVWTNLIVNACDALEHQGQISISTTTEDDFIVVEISDNGNGIPEEILPNIFEINYTTKNQGAHFGLGLGLPISFSIIKNAGGSLAAYNNSDGGASFLIKLPIRNNC